MGQPAYVSAYVRFASAQQACDAVVEFKKWIDLAESGKLPQPEGKEEVNGDYGISAVDAHDCEITYDVESMRYQNCIWQCQNIRDFWMTQPGVECVEQDVMTCEDSVSWMKGDE